MRYLPILIIAIYTVICPPSSFAAISLEISNPNISGNIITLDASITGVSDSQYLQGTLRRVGEKNYFGYTENHKGDWFEYKSNPDKSYIQSTFYLFEPVESSWSGQIRLKNNPDSKYYTGPGDYEVKLRRYTGNSSSSASDSNILTISLTEPTPIPEPSPTPEPTNDSDQKESAKTETPTPTPTSTPKANTSKSSSYKLTQLNPSPEGEVAGASDSVDINLSAYEITESPSPSPNPSENEESNKLVIPIAFISSGLAFTGAGGAYYLKEKRSKPPRVSY